MSVTQRRVLCILIKNIARGIFEKFGDGKTSPKTRPPDPLHLGAAPVFPTAIPSHRRAPYERGDESPAAIDQDIGYLAATPRHEQLNRLIDRRDQHAKNACGDNALRSGATLGVERMRRKQGKDEILRKVGRFANQEIRDPGKGESQRLQKPLDPLHDPGAQRTAALPRNKGITPDHADEQNDENEPRNAHPLLYVPYKRGHALRLRQLASIKRRRAALDDLEILMSDRMDAL